MNVNLITTDHCAQRTDLIATDNAVATPERILPMLKNAMRFLMALTLLAGLMAARPAHAQSLYLPKFTNILTLTDAVTKKNTTAYLDVTQDKLGILGGDLVIGSTLYKITGTLTWDGAAWPNWYWLNITATYTSGSLVTRGNKPQKHKMGVLHLRRMFLCVASDPLRDARSGTYPGADP
jgi:hypothetical protein